MSGPAFPERRFSGYVSRFSRVELLEYSLWKARYRLTLVPDLWRSTRTMGCRSFEDDDPAHIIHGVLNQLGLQGDISGGGREIIPYLVQYRESDFSLISRVMEEAGIFYFFREDGMFATGDTINAHPRLDPYNIQFMPQEFVDAVYAWDVSREVRPGRFRIRGFDWVIAETQEHQITTRFPSDRLMVDVYDYPGNCDTYTICSDQARIRMEEDEVSHTIITGQSGVYRFMPGYRFRLNGHPYVNNQDDFVITSVHHEWRSSSGSIGIRQGAYHNRFHCIPWSTVFRPPRVTPKPLIHSAQTAVVTDVAEHDPDAMARVRVRFHWERDRSHSCWARVAQPWAANNYGAFFPPSIGDEVIVNFLEGDPAQPIITGRVYNGRNAPPYVEERYSGWRTQSGNEIRITDRGSGDSTIQITQPNGNEIVLKEHPGVIEITTPSSRITLDQSGVRVNASNVNVSAATVNIDAGLTRVSGVLKCDVLLSNAVISSSYTPGAGNIW